MDATDLIRGGAKWVGLPVLIIALAIGVNTVVPVLGSQIAMGVATGLVLLVAYAIGIGRDNKST